MSDGPRVQLRVREPTHDLLSLPWLTPLVQWDATEVPLRDIPVGPSRHLVRFVEGDGQVYAVKEEPVWLARREYSCLCFLADSGLPAVRPVGLVEQPDTGNALVVTSFLPRSWQYRRLFMRLPAGARRHRERLLDAMASLLVELHRHGVFWGDCSLANTLFTRDGQVIQAHLVDAETSEVHPALTDGQRRYDLDILVENVVGGLADIAARLDRDEEIDEHLDAAMSVADRYQALWTELHREVQVSFTDRFEIERHLRRLNSLGFAVDEVRLMPAAGPGDALRVSVAVAGRSFHADKLAELAGIRVGEGQARILLNDLRSYGSALSAAGPALRADEEYRSDDPTTGVAASTSARLDPLPGTEVGRRWVERVLEPGLALVAPLVPPGGDTVQAFCDLLEVRWLLSERAGHDVGTAAALADYREFRAPSESVAQMRVVEAPTTTLPLITDALVDDEHEDERDWRRATAGPDAPPAR